MVQDVSGNTATQVVGFTVNSSQSSVFGYDANGNLSGVGVSPAVVYQYDAENRLVSVTSNSVVVLQCWYDGSGHRIAKREIIGTTTNTWQYVWDGWNLIAVLGADGSLKEFYTRGVGIAGDIGTLVAVTYYTSGYPSATYYLHNNHRGDVILARQGTNTVATLDYAPYGELRSHSGSYTARLRFSSKEYDVSTGLYHFPYRYYAPQWARWINRDLLYSSYEAGLIRSKASANLYPYAGDNPVKHVDPLGLAMWEPYGKYCGPGWCGDKKQSECDCAKSKDLPPPRDAMDSCCKDHDMCLGKGGGKECDDKMCECLKKVNPEDLDPPDGKDMGWVKKKHQLMLGLFCGLTIPTH
jgi:RHS repeat-associated protein